MLGANTIMEAYGSDKKNAEVLRLPALSCSIVCPVQIFASTSLEHLKKVERLFKAEWAQRSLFSHLGSSNVRNELAKLASSFTFDSIIVNACDVGPVMVNREEDCAPSLYQFSQDFQRTLLSRLKTHDV